MCYICSFHLSIYEEMYSVISYQQREQPSENRPKPAWRRTINTENRINKRRIVLNAAVVCGVAVVPNLSFGLVSGISFVNTY